MKKFTGVIIIITICALLFAAFPVTAYAESAAESEAETTDVSKWQKFKAWVSGLVGGDSVAAETTMTDEELAALYEKFLAEYEKVESDGTETEPEVTTEAEDGITDAVPAVIGTAAESSGEASEAVTDTDIVIPDGFVSLVEYISEKYDVSIKEAEEMLDAFLEYGDEHFADYDGYRAIKESINENSGMWISFIAAVLFGLSIAALAIIIWRKWLPKLSGTQAGMTRIGNNIAEANKDITEKVGAISEAVNKSCGTLESRTAEMQSATEAYQKKALAAEQRAEEYAALLAEADKALLESNEAAYVAAYQQMQMYKLLIDRIGLNDIDRSAVDLWASNALSALGTRINSDKLPVLNAKLDRLYTSAGGDLRGKIGK